MKLITEPQECLPLSIPRKPTESKHEQIVRSYLKKDPAAADEIIAKVEILKVLWADSYVKSSQDVKNPSGLFRWCCLNPDAEIRYREALLQRQAPEKTKQHSKTNEADDFKEKKAYFNSLPLENQKAELVTVHQMIVGATREDIAIENAWNKRKKV